MARPSDVRAVGRRVQPGRQVLRREVLEQAVDHLEIHALMAQGKLEVPDQRVLDGDAAREKDAVGRVHTPIDRTADLCRFRQRPDGQRESADGEIDQDRLQVGQLVAGRDASPSAARR